MPFLSLLSLLCSSQLVQLVYLHFKMSCVAIKFQRLCCHCQYFLKNSLVAISLKVPSLLFCPLVGIYPFISFCLGNWGDKTPWRLAHATNWLQGLLTSCRSDPLSMHTRGILGGTVRFSQLGGFIFFIILASHSDLSHKQYSSRNKHSLRGKSPGLMSPC